jgi:capsid protein
MAWFAKLRSLIGQGPIHEAAGRGRRAPAWLPSNSGVVALAATHTDLRTKSRNLVRRNAWAQAGIEAFVANAVGTGIKPQSLSPDERSKASVQALWRDWCEEAEAAGLTDFHGLQALVCRPMPEGGERLIRLRPRQPGRRPTPPCAPQAGPSSFCPVLRGVSLGAIRHFWLLRCRIPSDTVLMLPRRTYTNAPLG